MQGIPGYARGEDDTFLTYAEWYIVWSYREKAAWQRTHSPSTFPYFGAIRQYWSGYCCSYGVVRGRYPFNFGDHLMLAVIGTSFTVEYALKGAYESTVGRLTEWIAGGQPTEEDSYAAQVAQAYGDFVENRPFYEFSFASALQGLWSSTPLWGTHALRKWERKLWLTLDFSIEALYCGMITMASHAAYGVEDDFTYAVIDQAPQTLLSRLGSIRVVQVQGSGAHVVRIPRYQKFTQSAGELLSGQARFIEIAGNRQIMITAVITNDLTARYRDSEVLFSSPILTDPSLKRVAIRVPVASLDALAARLPIEHIYDY